MSVLDDDLQARLLLLKIDELNRTIILLTAIRDETVDEYQTRFEPGL